MERSGTPPLIPMRGGLRVVNRAESTRLLPSRNRQGAVSPKRLSTPPRSELVWECQFLLSHTKTDRGQKGRLPRKPVSLQRLVALPGGVAQIGRAHL